MPLLINNQRIDDGILQGEFAAIKAHFERVGNVSCCERDEEFRGYARENIIGRVLLSQEAANRIPAPTEAEIDAALARMIEEHGGPDRFHATTGTLPDHLPYIRQDIASGLQVDRLVDSIAPAPNPTEADLQKFYEDHLADFMTEEQVRASHISKNPKHGELRREVYETFRKLREQIQIGADFDELARQHSDRGADLIDLGFFKRGDLPEEVDFVAFSMRLGEISPVFSSSVGFHLLKLTGQIPAKAKPFDEVRDQVRAMLVAEHRIQRTRALVSELQKNAKIEQPVEEPAPQ